jgi:hypothetical protein
VIVSLQKLSYFQNLLIALWIIIVFLTTSHLRHGDVLFHTDVARDFLVLEEMVTTRSPTLIGPKSGGIQGVFHGPFWYYISLIPFILTGGSPILMGWFWWLLGVIASLVFFGVCYKYTNKMTVSLFGAVAFAIIFLPTSAGAMNTYIANIFSFLVFIFWYYWYQKPTMKRAILGWFSLGLLVQFQMAFAIPIAMLLFPVFIWKTLQRKKPLQLISILVFLLPLSTFLLFDIRHDWLQTRSVIEYLQTPITDQESILLRIKDRISGTLFHGTNIFLLPRWHGLVAMLSFGILGWNSKRQDLRLLLLQAMYWYVGWWILTLVFRGEIWNYYYLPFFSILLLVVTLVASTSFKASVLLSLLLLSTLFQNGNTLKYSSDRFNSSSWKLLSAIAEEGLSRPNQGYFVYSQDQFAYPLKYAFAYFVKTKPELKSIAYTKRAETVLAKSADDPNNTFSSSEDWQKNKLHIKIEPVEKKVYPYGYTLERFHLDEQTIQEPIDPNLILDLHFR